MRAARLADRGEPATLEAAVAKLLATERGFAVCDRAVQLLGGLGLSPASPVGRAWRDIRTLRFGGGTDEIMKFVIQRELYARA
jgi:alkylation response protein AidB-like acyl-CoA dehydrogenase